MNIRLDRKKGRDVKIVLVAVLSWYFAAIGAVQAAEKPMIAVYPTIIEHGVKSFDRQKFDLQEVTRRLEEALRATRKFRVYERSETVLKEWALEGDIAQSDLARERATKFAKLNNVGLIVQPMVVEFRLGSDFKKVDGLDGMYNRTDIGRLSLTSKVLSTTTGEIKYQITISDGFQREPELVEGKLDSTGSSDWIEMAVQVGVASATSIANAIYPITVIHYQNNTLFLNRGAGGGVKLGDELQLFSVGEDLIDPDTNEKLGRAEFLIGNVKIIQVKPKSSTAQPIDDLQVEPKRGDIVRYLINK